jgi:hypothetical protein
VNRPGVQCHRTSFAGRLWLAVVVPFVPGPLVWLPALITGAFFAASILVRVPCAIAAALSLFVLVRCLMVKLCISDDAIEVRNPFRTVKPALDGQACLGITTSRMPYGNGLVLTVALPGTEGVKPVRVAASASMFKRVRVAMLEDLDQLVQDGRLVADHSYWQLHDENWN